MAQLIVRPIAQGDHNGWRPLWDGYNAFYGREAATALPEANTRMTWNRFFDPAEPVHALVAERDGRIVGIVHYLFHRSTTMIGLNCYLQDLFTDAQVRGGGIGRALIDGVYAAARTGGAERVYWHTHETNATARRLYDQVAANGGFIVYGKAV